MPSTIELRPLGESHYALDFNMVADASSSTFTAVSSAPYRIDGYVVKAETNPGSTAPTDNYDITITDAESCDIMGGELSNRDTAISEQAIPKAGNAYGDMFVEGLVTCTVTNNAVVNATTKVIIYFRRSPK
jgi:hypothetical protein